MPTYVYTCDSCEASFEQFQSFKDEPLQTCPRCSNPTVRRVFQPVGIVFKGSGWYINDSRGSSSSTLNATNDTSKSDTSKSDTSKSDTKEKSSESTTSASSDSTASVSSDKP